MTYPLEFIMQGSGFFVVETAGEALPIHSLVYRGADSLWYLADADAAATMPVLGVTMGALRSSRRGRILRQGYIGDISWTWTPGGEIYASTTAGELTQTAPGGAGDITQIIGMAVTTTIIYFNSDLGSGGAGACALLEGHTAYVGFDNCKGAAHVNYFLCDGTADDVQIQQAIAYVVGLGGGSIFIERGNYDITAILTDGAGDDITIEGTGFDTVLTLANGVNGNVITVSQQTGWIIRNLKIDGNKANQTAGVGIYMDRVTNVVIYNVHVIDSFSHGIHFDAVSQGDNADDLIDSCIVENAGFHGFYVEGFRRGRIASCVSISSQRSGYLVGGGTDDCLVVNCHSYTDNASGTAGQAGFYLEGTITRRISVVNCEAYETGADGYGLVTEVAHNIEDSIVDGCIFNLHPKSGILWNAIDGIISNNTANDNGLSIGDGITIVGANNTVDGNRCSNNDRDGIRISSDGNVISGNKTNDNTVVGLMVDGGDDNTFTGNSSISNTIDGINIDSDGDDNIATGNVFQDNGRYGTRISNANCDRNRFKDNKFGGNVTADFSDLGTDTAVHELYSFVVDPNANLGRHPVVDMPDNTDTSVYNQIPLPLEYQQFVTCEVIVVAAASGNMVWAAWTDAGKLCSSEDYNAHPDSAGSTTALVIDDLECINIGGALTNIAAGDLIGVEFIRDGDNGSDDIGDSVYYLGIRMRYV